MDFFRVVNAYVARVGSDDYETRLNMFRSLESDPSRVGDYLEKNLISKKDARMYVMRHIKNEPYLVGDYFDPKKPHCMGIITEAEAKPIALSVLDWYPQYASEYVRMGILTEEDVEKFRTDAVSKSIQNFMRQHKQQRRD